MVVIQCNFKRIPSSPPFCVIQSMSDASRIFRVRGIRLIIANWGKWLGRQVNIKEANKQTEIYVGRSLTLHIYCFLQIDYA